MQFLYNIISTVGLIFYLPVLLSKKGPSDKKAFIMERLGLADYAKADIWVHTVSVGETIACLPFLKKLRDESPDKKIILSTTTYTGQAVARERFPEADRIMYMPLDAYPCQRHAADAIRPGLFASVETEIWPGLINSLKKQGSKIVLLNGRLSDDSFRGYRRIGIFMKEVLSQIDSFCMQGAPDAERIKALGADSSRVEIMGNFKFDMAFHNKRPLQWAEGLPGPILLAASTHSGEEQSVLDAYKLIREKTENLTLIIAPRHPERFDEVADLISAMALPCVRRSSTWPDNDKADNNIDIQQNMIILLDTIGELSQLFSEVDIAFIGGSLAPYGGHNIMEPAYWAKPAVFGPHMENFPVAAEFVQRKAAFQVSNAARLADTVIKLLSDKDLRDKTGQNARMIVEANTGAVDRALNIVRRHLGHT